MLDLRSDTVTRPDAGMRRAIAEAEVGDDVFGDDPTVNLLQQRSAGLLGKEAAIFVPSGTMANQIALRVQTRPGDQVVCEADCHIYRYEQGGPAALSGLLLACIAGDRGALPWSAIQPVLNPDDDHAARPSLICLENTHNRAGGRILPQDQVVEVGREAHARGLRLHLDGARLWNVHAATGTAVADLAAPADTVSVCFSKGLGAPVGSVLAGSTAAIREARRVRKLFGGGMRQVGILAAACLHALDHNLPRLGQDHEHARLLVEGLDNPALRLDHPVETNIVILRVADERRLLEHLRGSGILAVAFGSGRVRLVPNLMIDRAGILAVRAALDAYRGPAPAREHTS
jgi:threonine aldolase